MPLSMNSLRISAAFQLFFCSSSCLLIFSSRSWIATSLTAASSFSAVIYAVVLLLLVPILSILAPMPLLAIVQLKVALRFNRLIQALILTTHCCGCCISFSYVWVHFDQHIFFYCHSTVSFLDLFFNPYSKRLFNDGIHHIDQPLFGNLLDLLSVWKIFEDILMLLDD